MGNSPSTHRRGRPMGMTPDIPAQPPPDVVEKQFNELIQVRFAVVKKLIVK